MIAKRILRKVLRQEPMESLSVQHYHRFMKYSYIDGKCETKAQFDASITRIYHTIEKGLSYAEFRPGFGVEKVKLLVATLEEYDKRFGCESFPYKTGLSCLREYIDQNRQYGVENLELEQRILALHGEANDKGGTLLVKAPSDRQPSQQPHNMNFACLMEDRHSVRAFGEEPVDLEKLKRAIEIAQFTPSACNRQPWKTRIIANKELLNRILENQNGNSGFGQGIDKLLIITTDLSCFQKERELFQAFVDGGMYAESVLNALHYVEIASIPLSAALTERQEKNLRDAIHMKDSEVLILFIGVGNYTKSCLTTKSTRKPSKIDVYE